MTTTTSIQATKSPQSPLERRLIIDYLASKGYCMEDLKTLPHKQVKELMTAACVHASLKMAEIEARSQLKNKIHYPEAF